MTRPRKLTFMVLRIALLALVLLYAIVWLFGRNFLFAETQLTEKTLENLAARPGWTRDVVDTQDARLNGLLSLTSTDAPFLLLFGGNAFDLGTSQFILEDELRTVAANKAAYAYRGYDGSTGRPSESALVRDARAIVKHLEQTRGLDVRRQLVLLGQSLGTGVAIQLAAQLESEGLRPKALVLLSPYASMARVFDEHVPLLPIRFAVRDSLKSERFFASLNVPTAIVHGVEDRIIPIDHAKTLTALRAVEDTLFLEGHGHNDLWQSPRTQKLIARFIERQFSGEAATSRD